MFSRVVASLVLVFALGAMVTHVHAASEGVVDRVKANVAAAEASIDPAQRLSLYDTARRTLLFIEQLKEPPYSDIAADLALAELEAGGISVDSVALTSVETLADLITRTAVSVEVTQLRARAYEIIGTIRGSAVRAKAYITLARSAAGSAEAAVSYLQNSLSAAQQVAADDRDQLLADLVRLATPLASDQVDNLVDLAIAAMTDVRQRAQSRQEFALARLADTRYADAGANGLARTSTRLIDTDIETAVLTALAIPFDSSRARREALTAILEFALEKHDEDLFFTLATAFPGKEEQANVIRRIVEVQIAAGRAINAIRLVGIMPAGGAQTRATLMVVDALADAGYAVMAGQLYDRATASMGEIAVDERSETLAAVIRSSVEVRRFDDTMAQFRGLSNYDGLGEVLGAAAGALAKAGRLDDASVLVEAIDDEDVRDLAKAKVAVARMEQGDDVSAALDELATPEGRSVLLDAMVRWRAVRGDLDGAIEVASQIDVAVTRIDALLAASARFRETGNRSASERLGTLITSGLGALSDEDRDAAVARLVGDLAWGGELERAEALVTSIKAEDARTLARGSIAIALIEVGRPADALTLISAIPPVPNAEALLAEVYVSLAKDPAWLRRATEEISALKDDMLRVRTFRQIAEGQLARHDAYDWGMGTGNSRDRLAVDAEVGVSVQPAAFQQSTPIFSTSTDQLEKIEQSPSSLTSYSFPNLDIGVADLRREVPLPVGGKVSVTLAHFSPYNEKFLEDLTGGHTGISYASEAQQQLYPKIIVIESGVYTLGMLADALAGEKDLVEREGDTILLRAPVLVSSGASLLLSGEEAGTYRLSATAGSFIAVAGELYVLDTEVTSWDEETLAVRHADEGTPYAFRPYIVGWSGSNMMIGGTILNALGYAAPKSFGLSFSAGPTAVTDKRPDLPAPTGHVVDSSFRNFEYGFYSYEAEDVFLVGNEYIDNIVYAVDPHDRSKRLVIALNTTYLTHKKHGIITSREVDGSWIVGNVSFANHGSGFMLDRDSTDTLIYGNVAFDNEQDGLTLFESSCNLIAANSFFDNGRAGIKVRNSWDVAIFSNLITGNGQSAIEGYTSQIEDTSPGRNFVEDPYIPLTSFAAGQNVISDNRDGIKVRGVAGFSLFGQDFTGQDSPLLGGDARAFEGHMLRFSDNSGIAIRSTACLEPRPVNYCGFRESGVFDGLGLDMAYGDQRQSCSLTFEEASGQR